MAAGVLTPSPGDLSVKLMNELIGQNWQDLFVHGAQGAHLTLIGQLFTIFNGAIMTALVVLFATVTASGVISTAHSGEVMGKKYHSAWVPIRAISSIGLLTPIPWAKGLCLMQTMVLMFMSYGIGLADHLWTPAVQYMTSNANTLVAPPPPAGAWKTADGILRALVARDYFYSRDPQHTPIGSVTAKFYPGTAASGGPITASAYGSPAFQGYYQWVIPGPSNTNFGNFATITVKCAGPQTDPLCHAKGAAVDGLIQRLSPVAVGIVSHYHGGKNIPPPAPSAITALLNWYTQTVAAAGPAYVSQQQSSLQQEQKNFANQAEDEGWASAGMYYWKIARMNDRVARVMSIKPVVSVAPTHALLANVPNTRQTRLPSYLANAEQLMRDASGGISTGYDESLTGGAPKSKGTHWWGAVISKIESELHQASPLGMLQDRLTAPDPLSRLQNLGNEMIDFAETIFTGAAALSLFHRITLPLTLSMPVVLDLLSGISFAYYLPFLPFVLWTIAMLGWAVLVLESMVAAPLWAAAHGMPEGEGFAGQTGRQGYMLFLSVLIRPALMIFGFFLGSGLFTVFAWWVGQGIGVFEGSVQAHYTTGLVAEYVIVAIVAGLITAIAHQSFGLITWLPANVTRWVGQFGANLGEEKAVGETRGTVVAAGASVGRSAGANQKGAGEGVAMLKEQDKKKAAADEAGDAVDGAAAQAHAESAQD